MCKKNPDEEGGEAFGLETEEGGAIVHKPALVGPVLNTTHLTNFRNKTLLRTIMRYTVLYAEGYKALR